MADSKKTKSSRTRYYNGYELAKYRKWRGFKDSWTDYKAWLINHKISGGLIMSNPVRAAKALLYYRWMSSYLGAPNFIDRNLNDAEGIALELSHELMHTVMKINTESLTLMINADKRFGDNKLSDKIVLFEQTMPPILMGGFPNLKFVAQEPFHVMMPLTINQHADEYYLDTIESFGLPSDSCRVSASVCGAAIADELPIIGACLITNNAPCDSSVMNSSVVARRLDIPSMPACMPMRRDDEDTRDLAIAHVEEIIKFIEDNTGEKFDWDAFFKTVERYNEETKHQLELWDIAATDYNPLTCVAGALYRSVQWAFSSGTNPLCLEATNKLMSKIEEAYENKVNARPKTRHRCLVWGPPALFYVHFSSWAYDCWGVNIIAEMNSITGSDMISTTDKDEALYGVAKLFQQGNMRRHLTGGYEHNLEMFELYERFNCDMILFYDDLTCKGSKSMSGIIRDIANEKNIPLMWVTHDIYDPRTVPRKEMRHQFNDFMYTVMNEQPLDESLIDFDDSKGW